MNEAVLSVAQNMIGVFFLNGVFEVVRFLSLYMLLTTLCSRHGVGRRVAWHIIFVFKVSGHGL